MRGGEGQVVPTDGYERLGRFMERLRTRFGAEPDVEEVPPRVPGDGRVFALVCSGVPERGFVTGFTYGLSPFRRAKGQAPVRELCITMRSADPRWAKVPAITVAALRGVCLFDPGMVIGYKRPYVPPSRLNSLVLALPAPGLGLADPIDVAVQGADAGELIEIVGAHPAYPSERTAVHADGLGVLLASGADLYDPDRPPLVRGPGA
jgi:hypothetical protein